MEIPWAKLASRLQNLAAMKNVCLVLVLVAAVAGCGGVPDRGSSLDGADLEGYVEAAAELENGLAYDGCTWLVRIGDKEYAPTDASRPVIEAHTTAIGRTAARIVYRPTGKTGVVTCGWNTTRSLPAIDIASISAP